jgi:hypothetical protein
VRAAKTMLQKGGYRSDISLATAHAKRKRSTPIDEVQNQSVHHGETGLFCAPRLGKVRIYNGLTIGDNPAQYCVLFRWQKSRSRVKEQL